MATTQKSEDLGHTQVFFMQLGFVGLVLALVLLVAAAIYGDWQFVAMSSGSIAVSAAVLYGLKWYRKTYFATRRRQERRNRANALKG